MNEISIVGNVSVLCSSEQAALLKEMLSKPENAHLNSQLQTIIETDENGLIVLFKPSTVMTMELLWFLQSLMLAQRCFLIDEFLKKQGVIV